MKFICLVISDKLYDWKAHNSESFAYYLWMIINLGMIDYIWVC